MSSEWMAALFALLSLAAAWGSALHRISDLRTRMDALEANRNRNSERFEAIMVTLAEIKMELSDLTRKAER